MSNNSLLSSSGLGGGTTLGSSITKSTSFDVVVNSALKIVSWANGTDEEILAMVEAADRGEIDLTEYWNIGDTRTVHLSAMSATGVGESHAAQNVEFVLMDSTLQGMTPADSSKPLHFAVGLKHSLNEGGYINTNSSSTIINGWCDSVRRTWCNNVFTNSLPSAFKSCFRQFKWKTGKGDGATRGLLETTDLFALACEKQIFGSRTYSQSDEANLYNHWQWYQTSSNRIKKRGSSANTWWEASSVANGDASGCFCYVGQDGSASFNSSADPSCGISPFGCI